MDLVFSNRGGMSYEELREYLEHLRTEFEPQEVRIDWSAIRANQVVALSAGRRAGLQVADAVAAAFYCALEPSQYGFTEDRYARMLKPVLYSRKGRYEGYGLKLWPVALEQLQPESLYSGLREAYK